MARREHPDLIVLRGDGAGMWEGIVFDRNDLPWGTVEEMNRDHGQEWEATGSFEFRPDGTVAEVYRAKTPDRTSAT